MAGTPSPAFEISQAQLCYGGYEEEGSPPNFGVTSIWHGNILTLKKEKTETLAITIPTYITGKVFNRVIKLLSVRSHPLPRLASALLYCLPTLAFSSLPSNLSTYSSFAVESSKTSLLCWPTLIGKLLQMRKRPEIRELQLKLQSGRGQGTSVMLDSGSWCACMQDVHQYITFFNEFWLIIIAGYLFIYLL